MATTIQSSALDFNNIKNELKVYLEQKEEFTDYDFEASALNNILDVLAYNTHINALIANFSLNESFLNTAQLRSSVISLATGLGYIPITKTSAVGLVTVEVNLSELEERPATIDLPAFTRFTAKVDDITYTFQTKEVFTGTDVGGGIYRFTDNDGNSALQIFEGTKKLKTFRVGTFNSTNPDVYIIPDADLDSKTVSVSVFENITTEEYTPYTNITEATSISENSTIYILSETPNGQYQLKFGANSILGQEPVAGNKIEVDYIASSGAEANRATGFTPIDQINVNGTLFSLTATTVSRSAGGGEKEAIELIRRKAPFQFAAQNRMVTPEDYTALISEQFGHLFKDIKSWGGQDHPEPKFGTVFSSILFNDEVSEALQTTTKNSIVDLVDQKAVIAFGVEFADPIRTYIESDIFYQVNLALTPLTLNTLQNRVLTARNGYFTDSLGGFDKSFRRSNLLTLIDDTSPAVLSSRANIRMQQRITPVFNARNTFILTFPSQLALPDNNEFKLTSTPFFIGSRTCRIQNKLGTTQLQVVESGTGDIVVTSIGSYSTTDRTVRIDSFKPTARIGADFIKISVVPANQSAITPLNENILFQDEEASIIRSVAVDATN